MSFIHVIMNRLILILFLILVLGFQERTDYKATREKMVKSQIEARGIQEPFTLAAMRSVPRHKFVPKGLMESAYKDSPLPIGYGQTISQPYIVAFMTEIINPKKDFKVLEIGTGSGYQAAVLAHIVDSMYTIEIVKALFIQAKKRLDDLNYHNVLIKNADGYHGWEEKGPFDAIVVTARNLSVKQCIILSKSFSVRLEPLSKHKPLLCNSSEIPFIYLGTFLNIGSFLWS